MLSCVFRSRLGRRAASIGTWPKASWVAKSRPKTPGRHVGILRSLGLRCARPETTRTEGYRCVNGEAADGGAGHETGW